MSARRTPAAIAVSGMHRSGTSFIASVLPALGISLGDTHRLMKPGPDNPAGYYEVQSILELNEELLAHLGGAWDAPPVLDPGWEVANELGAFRDRAHRVVDETFGVEGDRPALIAFKDPRLSLLLPFWRTVLPIATTIVLVRDPHEVAQSLEARKYAVPRAQAAGLWLRYVLSAVANDPGNLLVRHAELFEALPATLARIAAHVGVEAPGPAAIATAQELLAPELRHHHRAERAPDPHDDALMKLASAVWNDGDVDFGLLPAVATDAIARGWLAPAPDSDVLARARADVIAARETLRQRNRQLAELTKSTAEPLSPQPRS